MDPFRYKPLEGLLKLNKENYKCINLLELFDKVEEDIRPSPEGRAKRLMLFFYLIDILENNNIPFYVKGGVILQYHLKEHARDTNDIDVLVGMDADEFYASALEAFKNNKYGLDISVISYSKEDANENYYFPTFNMFLSISYKGKEIDKFSLEGIYGELFNKVSPKQYIGPSIIKDDFIFLGVPIECVFSDKILAITSELKRPYKHLVDAYSISKIPVDINELKRYLKVILDYENKTRTKHGLEINEYKYEIKNSKEFTRNYYFPMIQSGYVIERDDMIQKMNQYMSKYLKLFSSNIFYIASYDKIYP